MCSNKIRYIISKGSKVRMLQTEGPPKVFQRKSSIVMNLEYFYF